MWKSPISPRPSEAVIRLPVPHTEGKNSVEAMIRARRSVRSYAGGALTLAQVAQLLWAAQGVSDGDRLRTAPSAGALYPLELYVVAGLVDGLPPGLYKYRPGDHTLLPILHEDRRAALCQAALGQESVREAPISLVITGIYERTTQKYGERGVRYVHMEAGHTSQNVYLQATSLGLGTVAIGAFDDSRVSRVLSLPRNERVLYIMPVGRHP